MTHHLITSTDATQQLHYLCWEPADAPRAVLQLVHGMEEYIMRYDVLARELTKRGWAVIGHDHLGHGLSGRQEIAERTFESLSQRGYFTDRPDGADLVIADIHLLNLEARRRWPHLPIFMMGHSMGSFFLRRYLTLHTSAPTLPLAGAVICGTGWYNALLTGSALAASWLVSRIRGPHCRSTFLKKLTSPHARAFRSEGEGAWLSRDPENVRRFKDDPMCGFGFTAGAYRIMYRNLLHLSLQHDYDRLRALAAQGRAFPILVVSGADDSVGGTRAVKRVAAQYRALGFPDVTEYIVPHDRHEVILEPDGPTVRRTLAEWLEARI